MYFWRCPLKYLSSSDYRSFRFRISSAFTIWRHWSTWAAWWWMYLTTSFAAALAGNGASCGDRTGTENYSQSHFGMWLVAFTSRVDHVSPRPIITEWFMRLLEFCNRFRGLFCSQYTPHSVYFLERGFALNIFRFGNHSWLFWFHQVWCAWIF